MLAEAIRFSNGSGRTHANDNLPTMLRKVSTGSFSGFSFCRDTAPLVFLHTKKRVIAGLARFPIARFEHVFERHRMNLRATGS